MLAIVASVFYHFVEKPFLVRGSMRSVVRDAPATAAATAPAAPGSASEEPVS